MATVSIRYIVRDVDAAIDFYCRHLGFHEVMHPAPTFAMLSRGDLRLVLSAPGGGPGGGGDFGAATVEALRKVGAHFRNEIVTGVGGKQILVDDPSGNPIELFEPTLPEASLSRPS